MATPRGAKGIDLVAQAVAVYENPLELSALSNAVAALGASSAERNVNLLMSMADEMQLAANAALSDAAARAHVASCPSQARSSARAAVGTGHHWTLHAWRRNASTLTGAALSRPWSLAGGESLTGRTAPLLYGGGATVGL